jgi:hypothetical protein
MVCKNNKNMASNQSTYEQTYLNTSLQKNQFENSQALKNKLMLSPNNNTFQQVKFNADSSSKILSAR